MPKPNENPPATDDAEAAEKAAAEKAAAEAAEKAAAEKAAAEKAAAEKAAAEAAEKAAAEKAAAESSDRFDAFVEAYDDDPQPLSNQRCSSGGVRSLGAGRG